MESTELKSPFETFERAVIEDGDWVLLEAMPTAEPNRVITDPQGDETWTISQQGRINQEVINQARQDYGTGDVMVHSLAIEVRDGQPVRHEGQIGVYATRAAIVRFQHERAVAALQGL